MFEKIWGGIIVISIITGFLTGNLTEVANAASDGAVSGVSFCISLAAIMAFWGGIMHIAENAGFTKKLEKVLSPILNLMFKGVSVECRKNIVKNVAANVLGLGNAATPFGIKAVEEMKKGSAATNEAIRFIVLNTASIQLIPTTLISMRAAAGSPNAAKITVPIWITSAIALAVGLLFARIGEKIWK